MERWEYCEVAGDGFRAIFKRYAPAGANVPTREADEPLTQCIAGLGRQGWELVTMTQTPDGERWIFKRRKRADAEDFLERARDAGKD